MVNADMRAWGEMFKSIQTALEKMNGTLEEINKTLQLQRNVGGDACYVPNPVEGTCCCGGPVLENKDIDGDIVLVSKLSDIEYQKPFAMYTCSCCRENLRSLEELRNLKIIDGKVYCENCAIGVLDGLKVNSNIKIVER